MSFLKMRSIRTWLVAIVLVVVSAGVLRADTIVLEDGTIIEGKITNKSRRYVRVKTRFGEKSYRRSDISKIIEESAENSAAAAMLSIQNFDKLPDIAKTLKNARALCDLGRYDEVPPLVEPLIGKGTKFDDMQIRWLLIDHFERQAKWEDAEKLLKQTLDDGREPDKIRAQAHLDIFKQNPGYKLREINEKRARDFLDRDMYLKGKKRDALQDPAMMDAALREMMRQILRDEDVSIYALKESMSVEDTLEAIHKLLDEKSRRSIVEVLPYREMRDKVEKSIYRATAIVPDATRGFELDLVRTEAEHLRGVITALLGTLSEAYPGDQSVNSDEFGRLTPEGREAWRERCDGFLDLSRPVVDLIEYLLRRTRAFPDELKPFIKEWEDALERVQQMQHNTVRNRDRTHV